MSQTLSEKARRRHVAHRAEGGPGLLYIDLHLVHEVTSPQAFDGLRLAGGRAPARPHRGHRRPQRAYRSTGPIADPISARQVAALVRNARGRDRAPRAGHPSQGIVHVIGPELGLTLPGMMIVCGDWHTATHGAFGAWRSASGQAKSSTCSPPSAAADPTAHDGGELRRGGRPRASRPRT